MRTGTYEEPLPCGGKLKVSKTSWEISYYFPGPDLRYNGEFISLSGASIEQYISAFTDNWDQFERLKASIPSGGEFSTHGKMGMTIRIGGYHQGVCLRSYHMPVNSVQQLERVIGGYRYAASRAPQIQQFLQSLDQYVLLKTLMTIDAKLPEEQPNSYIIAVVNPELPRILNAVHDTVIQGNPLSAAFAPHPDVFEEAFITSVRYGEIYGEVNVTLRRYVERPEERAVSCPMPK